LGPECLIWILPCDHYIGDEAALAVALKAASLEAQKNQIVTFGIKPTHPETGYGYIRLGINDETAKFFEKPDLEAAARYVASGNYLWNSGMFLAKAKIFQEEIAAHPFTAGTSFDKAVMEKLKNFSVAPLAADWHDIGTQESLQRVRGISR